MRVLDRIPTKAEFYGGLYLKPFVIRGYLKMEAIFDLVTVNDSLQKCPNKGTWRYLGMRHEEQRSYSSYLNAPKHGSWSLGLYGWKENPLKRRVPSFMKKDAISQAMPDWSYAFI